MVVGEMWKSTIINYCFIFSGMVNDVIGGHVTSNFYNILCKFFLFSSKNIRQHFFVK